MLTINFKTPLADSTMYGFYAVWKIRGRIRCYIKRKDEFLVIYDDGGGPGISWFSLAMKLE